MFDTYLNCVLFCFSFILIHWGTMIVLGLHRAAIIQMEVGRALVGSRVFGLLMLVSFATSALFFYWWGWIYFTFAVAVEVVTLIGLSKVKA